MRGRPGEAVPVIAHAGEWVIPPEQLASLRESGNGAGLADLAGIGAGGGDVIINLTVGNVVGHDGARQLAEMVRTELIRMQRRTPLGFG